MSRFSAALAVLLDDALSHKLPVEHVMSIHERIKLLHEEHPSDDVWLAGWLEGEGSFLKYWNGSSCYPRVQAVSVDRDVLERVAILLGGATVRVHKKATDSNQEIFLVKVTGAKAIDVMKRVRPFMGERRGAKIDELLAEFA